MKNILLGCLLGFTIILAGCSKKEVVATDEVQVTSNIEVSVTESMK